MSASDTKRTCCSDQSMSAFGGKADIAISRSYVCFVPIAELVGLPNAFS